MNDAIGVIVTPASSRGFQRAQLVADSLEMPFSSFRKPEGIHLVVGEVDAWIEAFGMRVGIDFDSNLMRHRLRSGHNELIGRAVGVKANKYPNVFDATGGLGRDAFVLASLGCYVTVSELSPVLFWLLTDAIDRASMSQHGSTREAVERLNIVHGDSTQCSIEASTVIYLDPMFPKRKKSSAVKKDATILQMISSQGPVVENEMLRWALGQSVERVVMKRPIRDNSLPCCKPSHVLRGKSVRFDVFVQSF